MLVKVRTALCGFLLVVPLLASAGGFNWKGAAAGLGQGLSDWAERESYLEHQKKLMDHQYELERRRLEYQSTLEEQQRIAYSGEAGH